MNLLSFFSFDSSFCPEGTINLILFLNRTISICFEWLIFDIHCCENLANTNVQCICAFLLHLQINGNNIHVAWKTTQQSVHCKKNKQHIKRKNQRLATAICNKLTVPHQYSIGVVNERSKAININSDVYKGDSCSRD